MGHLLRDLRFAVRSLRANPGFATAAVLTLAIGVGVSGAVFSVVSGTLLNPTPWQEAERLVFLWDRNRDRANEMRPLSFARFQDVRAQTRSLGELGAARGFQFVLTDRSRYENVPGAFVTPGVFDMVGLRMALGRPLVDDDARPGAPPAVVISYPMWRDRFGFDPDVVGRELEIERRSWTVVGVLARNTWFPNPGTTMLAALRPVEGEARDRTNRSMLVVGRLAPAASVDAVRSELDVISARLEAEYPDTDRDWPLTLQTVSEGFFGGPARAGLYALAGAVGFLLLIACANVTGLLLARSATRQREMAVRAAVGASRRRLALQLLTENTVLALAAVPFALVITRVTLEFIYSQVPSQVSQVEQVFRFDPPVWLFAAGTELLAVFVFGLTPALHGARVDLQSALKEGGDRGSSAGGSQWLRSFLVIGQLAGSVVLLVGASLLGQSFLKITSADPGFEMENLFYAPIQLPDTRYPEESHRVAFERQLVERVATVPGVEVVGLSNSAASISGGPTRRFVIASKRGERAAEQSEARWAAASPGYLSALGLKLLLGRPLDARDDETGRRVAVVSEAFSRAHFRSGESPLGQRIVLDDETEVEIVGVVQDVKQIGFNTTQRPQVYVPYAQEPSAFMSLVARTSVEPLSIGPLVREHIGAIDPLLPVFRLTTALRERALNLWPIQMFAAILALVGGIGLVMATVGIHGVVRYSAERRTREFGIRSALGAAPGSLVVAVLRSAWTLTAVGLVLGLLLSFGLGRVLQAILYEVDAFQPRSLLLPTLLLALSSLVAAAYPAVRAGRVDPMVALRAE